MSKLNQRGVVHLFVPLILLLGLIVGVYLVTSGNPLKLFSKAALSKPVGPETSFTLVGPAGCNAGPLCAIYERQTLAQKFEVKLYARSDIEKANLFTAKMTFPKDLVEVTGINKDGSFVGNWVEEFYDNATGEISLVGGVPAPGYQTTVGGEGALMATISFNAKALGKGAVSLTDSSQILSNLNNINILTIKRPYQISIEVKPVSTPTPVPVEEPLGSYMVKPYLVYPADKTMYPEYETAVKNYLVEMQAWYKQKVGVSFNMASLKVVRSSENYLTIRCGPTPSQACLNDPSKLDGNVGMYMNKAIHNGVEQWEEKTAALIFAAGAGGYAGSNKHPNDTGWAIVGDWVLEPISGVASSWGIPCKYSNGWQCTGGVPKGTPAHELGHAFGLPHPGDQYKDQSIMQWHGGYPSVGFLPSEVEQLKASPFFKNETVSPAPAIVFSCDANKDGVKDAKDGEFVKSCWNKPATGACAMVDVNGDKTISILDVQKFSGNCPETFSSTCQPRPDCLDARPACAIAEPAGGWCAPTSSPTPAPVQKGDGNQDGKINLIDMSVIHTDWMKDKAKVSNFRGGIDMNNDGLINTFDFSAHRNILLQLGVIKSR